MAVLVEFEVHDASVDQMVAVEARTQKRGQALGRPPFAGCMFLAATARASGFHFVSVWRTEATFRAALEEMIGPDMAAEGAAVSDIEVAAVFSMAMPGTGAS